MLEPSSHLWAQSQGRAVVRTSLFPDLARLGLQWPHVKAQFTCRTTQSVHKLRNSLASTTWNLKHLSLAGLATPNGLWADWRATATEVRLAPQLLGSPQPFRLGRDANPPVMEVTQGIRVIWDTDWERGRSRRDRCVGWARMLRLGAAEASGEGNPAAPWLLVAPGTCPRHPRLGCPSGSWSLWLLSLCPPYVVGHKSSVSLCCHSGHPAAACNFRSVSSSGKILGTQIPPGYGW